MITHSGQEEKGYTKKSIICKMAFFFSKQSNYLLNLAKPVTLGSFLNKEKVVSPLRLDSCDKGIRKDCGTSWDQVLIGGKKALEV